MHGERLIQVPRTERYRRVPIIILLGIFSLYSGLWVYFTLLRYYSFNANVFDLGLAASGLYSIAHGGLISTAANPYPIPFTKLIMLVLAPFFYLDPNPAWLVVFQSIWIALGIFPLYLIARKYLQSAAFSIMIAASYLLYYPLSGVNWFDFHFMALFPTFFLTGFYLHATGRRRLSLTMMVLASITDYLVPLIVGFFCVYTLIKGRGTVFSKKERIYTSILFSIVAVIFILPILYTHSIVPFDYVGIKGASYSVVFSASYAYKISYLARMQLPVFMVSFLAPEALIMTIPYYVLAFVNTYQPYLSTMYFQYPALTAPVIFIATVIGLSRIKEDPLHLSRNRPKLKKNAWKYITSMVLIFNLILFSFYTPIGGLYTDGGSQQIALQLTGNDYSYNSLSSITVHSYDVELQKIISSIPKGSSVLIQNNMPQLTAGYAWMLPDFYVNGSYPQYIVVDPYSVYYANYSVAYHLTNYTMKSLSAKLISTGYYREIASYMKVALYEYVG